MTRPADILHQPAGGPARSGWWARHPQCWLWVVAGAGWVWLVAAPLVAPDAMTGHGSALSGAPATWPAAGALLGHVAATLAMVAVMTPLIAPNVRSAALRSPRRTRPRVTLDVTLGWTGVWLVAAPAITVLTVVLMYLVGDATTIAVTAAIAIAWQYSTTKRHSLVRCSRLFAPPLGPAAGPAARRYAAGLGRDCVLNCWPLMALMVAAQHLWPAVAAVLGLSWFERRRRPHHDPATTLVVTGIAAVAMIVIGLAAVTA